MRMRLIVLALLFVSVVPQFSGPLCAEAPYPIRDVAYTTGWVGNSFPASGAYYGGPAMKHVLHDVSDICVGSDGTVYTNATWSERRSTVTVIRNRQILTSFAPGGGGSGDGGHTVACDNTHFYVGMNWSDGTHRYYGVERYSRSTNKKVDGMIVSNVGGGHVEGIAVSATECFVTDPALDKINVFSLAGRSVPTVRTQNHKYDFVGRSPNC